MKLRRKKAQQSHAHEPDAVDDPMAIAQRILTQGLDAAPSRQEPDSRGSDSQLLTAGRTRDDDINADEPPDPDAAVADVARATGPETSAGEADAAGIDTSDLPGWDFHSLDDEIASLTPMREDDLSDATAISAEVTPTADEASPVTDGVAPDGAEMATDSVSPDVDDDGDDMDDYAGWDVDALDREILSLTPHSGDYLPDLPTFDDDAQPLQSSGSQAIPDAPASVSEETVQADDAAPAGVIDDVADSGTPDGFPGWDLDSLEDAGDARSPEPIETVGFSSSTDGGTDDASDDSAMQTMDGDGPSAYTIQSTHGPDDQNVEAALAELPGWDSMGSDSLDGDIPSYSMDAPPSTDEASADDEPSPWVFSAGDQSQSADDQDPSLSEWGLDDESGWDFSAVEPPADSSREYPATDTESDHTHGSEATVPDTAEAPDTALPDADEATPPVASAQDDDEATASHEAELPEWDAPTP